MFELKFLVERASKSQNQRKGQENIFHTLV